MNTITIEGRTFKYKVRRWYNGRRCGETIFYEKESHYKFLWWKWSEPIELFYVSLDIEDSQHSRELVRKIVLSQYNEFSKCEKRQQEINSNQII
jgi:hypothetical protein